MLQRLTWWGLAWNLDVISNVIQLFAGKLDPDYSRIIKSAHAHMSNKNQEFLKLFLFTIKEITSFIRPNHALIRVGLHWFIPTRKMPMQVWGYKNLSPSYTIIFIQYNPNQKRNLMGIQGFRPPYPNSSHI